MGAVEPLEQPYIKTPLPILIRSRLPWLVVLFVAGLATRNVLEFYSTVDLESIQKLMWFVPLIVGAGGNSGTQSATLVIRALALGRLELNQARKVLARELVVGIVMGVCLGLVGMMSAAAWSTTRFLGIVATVGCAVAGVVTLGALIGSGIPLLFHRLKIDPAVASNPFITSMCDISGLILYMQIAQLFLA